MSLQSLLPSFERALSSLLIAIAFAAILATATTAWGGNKLFVGGLSWDTSGESTRMKVRPLNDRVLVQRTNGSGGSTSAEAFVETSRGTGTLATLPNPFGSTNSGAEGVDCEDGSGICLASGSVENTSGDPQPIVFTCTTSACASWTATLLPLPSGHTMGEALCPFIPQPSGLADAAATGWTSDSSGVAKAVAWLASPASGWTVTVLNELGSLPTPPKESFGACHREIKLVHAGVAGAAVDDSGDEKPVVWYYDSTLTAWGSPIVLPLPPGSSEGSATALTVTPGAPGAEVVSIAANAKIDDGGTPGMRALLQQCTTTTAPATDCGSAVAWQLTTLTPLPGHGSSRVLEVEVLPNGYAMLAGTSYPSSTDPNDTGEATLWIVDSSTHAIVATLRASDHAADLAAGDVPRILHSFRASPGDGLAVWAVSGSKLGGGPRRWLMTEVPWNRRVADVALVSTGGSSFDVSVEWRIDLGGSVAGDTELGAEVGLEINDMPETPIDHDDCIIWDIQDGCSYTCEGLPDGAICGTATLNTNPVSLTCDAESGTCGLDFTTVFSGVSIDVGDSIKGSLVPMGSAEAETVTIDDVLEVMLGFPVPSLDGAGLLRLVLLVLVSGGLIARSRGAS